MPPRRPGRAVPPVEMPRAMGVDPGRTTRGYSGHAVNHGPILVHHVFSVVSGTLHAVGCARAPSPGRDHGTRAGLAVTAVFHGAVLPAAGWAPPVWRLPAGEIMSETIGHLVWAWSMDLVVRGLGEVSKNHQMTSATEVRPKSPLSTRLR